MQDRFHYISLTAIERLTAKTGAPKAYLYHIATFDNFFSLEGKTHRSLETTKIINVIDNKAKQKFVALRNHDTEAWKIDTYISRKGYGALQKVLKDKKPETITGEITASGLRGRSCGSAIGPKWEAAYKAKKDDLYVVCSANEAGTHGLIGKFILETDPHAIIEGMLIAAYALGAKEGYIVIKKEHDLVEERLRQAIQDAHQKGFLGENIQGSGFNFTIQIHRGAGAAVVGETTSLLETLAGHAGDAHAKYIPLEEVGFRRKPTVVSNVETWVNIPVIIEKGAQWAAANSTKVLSLPGHVKHPGLLEVSFGITLREIIEDIGGGITDGGKLKAVMVGGSFGGIIPAAKLDVKIGFEDLGEAGAIMGSGAIWIIDDKTCMVDVVRQQMEILSAESCGKCTPCREGLFAFKNTLDRICRGEGKESDIAFLEEVSGTIAETSLCNFGVFAVNPVLSSLRYFKNEYEEHIKNKKCGIGM
jgi:NADH-quinone oxidoreductase subunit F